MCGIAGILRRTAGPPPDPHDLGAMVARLRHRGPDGTGVYADDDVGLVHARLSIIGLDDGAQPIANEDATVHVVQNGEIFNFIELRRDLERNGHRFRTRSDAEVIVHLYEEHGERFVEHLNGQFAVALWDARRKRLVLARDRVGIRPLFYTDFPGGLAFASEVKSLFALRGVERAIDARALAEICTYWSPLAPRTAFRGISSLQAGHILVQEHGTRRIAPYWRWTFPEAGSESKLPEEELAAQLEELLADAVRLQLRSDVPVGSYLSGGLDSSIIAALARRFSTAPLRTFSLTFEDAEFDESVYQSEMVGLLGTAHTSIRCRRADIAAAFPRAIAHAETPILRTAPVPMMLLAGHVRDAGYKVVLTGEGADEVFGGYDLFKEAKIRRSCARNPGSPARTRLFERLYPYLEHSPVAGKAFTSSFFTAGAEHASRPWFGHLPRWTTTQRIARFFSPALRAAIGVWDPFAAIEERLPSEIGHWSPLARDQYIEAHTLMTGYLLCSQGDRMAMAHSVETRVPFLDHRVIEFANALPPRMKVRCLVEKYLLRRSVEGLVPDVIRHRPKQPYRAPDSESFFDRGEPADYVAEMFSTHAVRDAGYFDPGATSRLLEKCRAGRAIGFADNMAFVAILSTMLLHHQLILGHDIAAGAAAKSADALEA